MKHCLLIFLPVLLCSCAGIQTRYHRVERGETLSGIARRYHLPEKAIAKSNPGLVKKGRIAMGSKLYIPFEENPKWNRAALERTIPAESRTVATHESGTVPRFGWPVMGAVSSPFGPRRGSLHEGIDIAARRGTAVRAARSGHVIYSSNRISGYGNLIIIKHPDQYATVYAHLNNRLVKKGDYVSRGQLIGRVGSTGHATGPHLHFEVRSHRAPVNPLEYLHGQVASR